MTVARRAIRALILKTQSAALGLAVAIGVAFAATALAQPRSYGDPKTGERWAWSQIRRGLPANFNLVCDGWPDPKKADDPAWRDENKSKCRTLSAAFVVDILTKPSLRGAITYRGVDISGAKIVGDVDLAFAKIDWPVKIDESRFEGGVSLRYARAMSLLELVGSVVVDRLDAYEFRSEGDLSLRRTSISQAGFDMNRARIAGLIDLDGATCAGDVEADSLQVGGDLFMRSDTYNTAHFKNVTLRTAKIAGNVEITGTTFDGALDGGGVQVGESLILRSESGRKTSFKNVTLVGAKVSGALDLDGVSISGLLDFNRAQVSGGLFMRSDARHKANFEGVDLRGATIDGEIDMDGANFDGDVDARSLHVGGSLFMNTLPGNKNRFGRINKTSFSRFNLKNARITGQVDMSGVSFHGDLDAPYIHVGGSLLMRSADKSKAMFKNVNLSGASVAGQTEMSGAIFGGDIEADSLRVGESLLMKSEGANKAHFKNVILRGANISSQADMGGAVFDGGLDARFLQVGGALLMDSHGPNAKSSFQKVDLRSAKISGELSLWGASLHGDLYAPFLQVGGSVSMRSHNETKASFKTVDLSNAKVTGQMDLSGASLDGDLNADFLQIGGSLLMRSDGNNKASFKTVNLSGANIAGRMDTGGAIFRADMIANGLRVGGDVSMRTIYTDALITMSFAQLGGNLDLRGSDLSGLDLHGVSIAGEMRLGDSTPTSMVCWRAPDGQPDLIDLRNAHLGSLSDNQYSWPKHKHLDGLAFAHLGGSEENSGTYMVDRGPNWWDSWAAADDDHSLSLYEQLASIFTGVGDHDAADEIHYEEQVHAAEQSGLLGFVGSTLMRWGAGYGIGSYMFRALYWAFGLSLIGALILRLWVKGVADRNRSFLWCFGASVNKLLPGVNLNKEFADFFDDPAHNKFTPRQQFFFVVLAALGWVLGLIVLAAFAAITHGT